jgi:hypothetical protein
MNTSVVLAIAGCAALLVGLFGGGVKAKEIEVPKISTLSRVFSSGIGVALIGTGIFLELNNLIPSAAETGTPSPQILISNTDPALTLSPQPEIPTTIPATPTLSPQPEIPTTIPATPTSIPPTATLTRAPTRIPPTATSAPIIVTDTYNISECCGYPGTQRSPAIDYKINVRTVSLLRMEFSLSPTGCSDVYLHVLLDGTEIRTIGPIGPDRGIFATGSIDLSPYISGGQHILTISPEGITGGCNSGFLESWAGDLTVYTNEYPE